MDTDEEDSSHPSHFADLPPRPEEKGKGKQSYGRRLKDKLTGTTHEQREQERYRRNQEEDEAYRQHMHVRRAMTLAEQTGEPQFLGKDNQGFDVYLEPSYGVRPPYQQQGRMVNPYSSGVCKFSPLTQKTGQLTTSRSEPKCPVHSPREFLWTLIRIVSRPCWFDTCRIC